MFYYNKRKKRKILLQKIDFEQIFFSYDRTMIIPSSQSELLILPGFPAGGPSPGFSQVSSALPAQCLATVYPRYLIKIIPSKHEMYEKHMKALIFILRLPPAISSVLNFQSELFDHLLLEKPAFLLKSVDPRVTH